jgi:hypothetical protein
MKTLKIGVILLALLLAAMAMVPMVSAAAVDVQNIRLPQLQTDNSQTSVVVNAALSPISGNDTYAIPTGSIIHHSKDGTTQVFDSTGKQILLTDDVKSTSVFTPQGPKSSTRVHAVPQGSLILDSTTNKNTTYVTNDQGQLILTVIDDSLSRSDSNSVISPRTYINGPFYIEWAENTALASRLDKFVSTWQVPTAPQNRDPNRDTGEKLAIFNGIRPQSLSLIIQPVLEWNVNNNNFAWTAASWRFTSSSDNYYSPRINVNQNDAITGTMEYTTIGGQTGWKVTTADTSAGSSTYLFTNAISTNTNLDVLNTLEAASNTGIDEMGDVCGSIGFNNVFTRNDGQSPGITLTGTVSNLITQRWPGYFSVIISPNPGHVTLHTPY